MQHEPESGRSDPLALRLVFTLCAIVVVAQCLGFVRPGGRDVLHAGLAIPPGSLWGVDSYAFYPPIVFGLSLAGLIALAIMILFYARDTRLALKRPPRARR